MSQPQYRLVSRGQSFTGQEVIELHIYNQSRGIYEKVPAKITLENGVTFDDLRNKYREDNVYL
jgi:hypothetical protein